MAPRLGHRLSRWFSPTQLQWPELLAAFIGGWLLRFVLASAMEWHLGDSDFYSRTADGLLHHGMFTGSAEPPLLPDAYRPPGYSMLLAVIRLIAGDGFLPVRLVQVTLLTVTAVLLALSVGRFVPSCSRWVLWALCLSPFEGYFAGVMLSEALCAALVALATAVMLGRLTMGRHFVAGIVLGTAALTRDQLIVLPFFWSAAVALLLWRIRKRWRTIITSAVALSLGMFAVVTPWTARNYAQFEKFIPISAGRLGYNLWIGTWERDGSWLTPQGPVFPSYAFADGEERKQFEEAGAFLGTGTPKGDRALQALALKRMREDPIRTVATWLRRWPYLWFGTRTDLMAPVAGLLRPGTATWVAWKSVHWGLNFLIVVAGFATLLIPTRSRRVTIARAMLAVPVVCTAMVYLPLHSTENRYSFCVLPCLLALAAMGAQRAWSRFKPLWARTPAPT